MRHTLPFVLALTVLATAGCASDGPDRPVVPGRVSPNRPAPPDGVTEVRETLASQRAQTLSQMDPARPQPNTLSTHESGNWYDPIFDVADMAASLFSWIKF